MSLITRDGVQQIQLLIFSVAFFHIISSFLAFNLGIVKMKRWELWEAEIRTNVTQREKVLIFKGKDKTPDERRVAICIFDDVAEECREAAHKYYNHYLPFLLEACNDKSTDVRQAAVYGVGVVQSLVDLHLAVMLAGAHAEVEQEVLKLRNDMLKGKTTSPAPRSPPINDSKSMILDEFPYKKC